MSNARREPHSWRLPAATFGLGVAALAGIISVAPATPPSGRSTEPAAQAIVVASQDAPINILAAHTSCSGGTTTVYCAY
jgi:hypothetical protein